ncbi:MAG: hypothetical protein H6807_02910 [Planctomycetes bacterium]|nr:hypothetical protein [Planctomycetota bacterium]
MTGIRIRSYKVGFGDCFLVSIPDGSKRKHMLIDFGNAPGKAGSNDDFPAIAADIERETGGHLDLVVMTHEHLDDMEGFRSQKRIFDRMTVDWVWMSLPSAPDYYERYPAAERQLRLRELAFAFAARAEERGLRLAPSFATLLRNNLSNAERIDYLRGLPRKGILYLRRGNSVLNRPFTRAVKVRVLAPESDMSVYYAGAGREMAGLEKSLAAASGGGSSWFDFPGVVRVPAPTNLSTRDWRLLEDAIQTGSSAAIRQLDKAANNTSLVFQVETQGKRLLFTGDAELESWALMRRKAARHLGALDFLKVSHHGSHNGTDLDLLDTLLPTSGRDDAVVLVSTRSKVYGSTHPVPDASLLKELKRRCRRLISTDDLEDRLWADVEL